MTDTLMTRRQALAGAASLATGLGSRAMAQTATAWPDKPVRVVVPYPPGGGADTLSRLLFSKVQEDLGQPFVIDNRAGGGATIGPAIVAKAAPDGLTILYDGTGFSIDQGLLFIPVFVAGTMPSILGCYPAVEQKTVADIIASSKTEGFDWASSGNGSLQHLTLELFRARTGIKATHIPFKGGGLALNDVMGGHVKFLFVNAAGATAHVKSGKLRAIAHTGEGRLAALPDVPSMAETLPGFVAYEWNGVYLPAGTPQAIVEKLNAALNAVIKDPSIIERAAKLSIALKGNSQPEAAAYVNAEIEKWTKIIRDGNIKPE
jgi:tripartite-type tricarboxylate transporter receptor subunit TctC